MALSGRIVRDVFGFDVVGVSEALRNASCRGIGGANPRAEQFAEMVVSLVEATELAKGVDIVKREIGL